MPYTITGLGPESDGDNITILYVYLFLTFCWWHHWSILITSLLPTLQHMSGHFVYHSFQVHCGWKVLVSLQFDKIVLPWTTCGERSFSVLAIISNEGILFPQAHAVKSFEASSRKEPSQNLISTLLSLNEKLSHDSSPQKPKCFLVQSEELVSTFGWISGYCRTIRIDIDGYTTKTRRYAARW